MKRYLVVDEHTATGCSAYSPDLPGRTELGVPTVDTTDTYATARQSRSSTMQRHFTPMLLLALTACASAQPGAGSAPASTPARVEETSTGVSIHLPSATPSAGISLDVAPERAWAVLPSAYEALGIPVDVNDPAARTVGTRKFSRVRIGGKRTSELVRCGNQGAGPSAMSNYRIQLSILSTLESPSSARTLLRTQVTGSATAMDGSSTGAVHCVSTGELEQQIAALVAQHATR